MKRSLGVRYLPLAGLVAIQLLIVAVAPSVQEKQTVAAGGDSFDPTQGSYTDPSQGVPVDDEGAVGTPVTAGDGTSTDAVSGSGNQSRSDAGGGDTRSSTAGRSGGQGGPTAQQQGGGGQQAAQGDTSHCMGDRQFDPAIDFYAPPCVRASPTARTRARPTRASAATRS